MIRSGMLDSSLTASRILCVFTFTQLASLPTSQCNPRRSLHVLVSLQFQMFSLCSPHHGLVEETDGASCLTELPCLLDECGRFLLEELSWLRSCCFLFARKDWHPGVLLLLSVIQRCSLPSLLSSHSS